MQIKAIETRYAGHLFRSRLEARWAVFFDALGIPWHYEREGYELPSGRYLPDFWLPKQRYWLEIKGEMPTEQEEQKAEELCRLDKSPVYIFYGTMFVPPLNGSRWAPASILHRPAVYATTTAEEGDDSGWVPAHGSTRSTRELWCECLECGGLGIVCDGWSNALSCKGCPACSWAKLRERPCPDHGLGYQLGCPRLGLCADLDNYAPSQSATYHSPRLRAAYERAVSARFEHGQSG